jgi:hypothetical protein
MQPVFRTPEDIRADSDQRAQEEQTRQDAIELVLMYAQDLVDMWPTITLRTLGTVTNKINTLRLALKQVKR